MYINLDDLSHIFALGTIFEVTKKGYNLREGRVGLLAKTSRTSYKSISIYRTPLFTLLFKEITALDLG